MLPRKTKACDVDTRNVSHLSSDFFRFLKIELSFRKNKFKKKLGPVIRRHLFILEFKHLMQYKKVFFLCCIQVG